MISFKHTGDFKFTTDFLKRNRRDVLTKVLSEYGVRGVEALSKATPVDTGTTAASWSYKVTVGEHSARLCWMNSNVNEGVPIALVIQYGHAMPNGGYVEGIDYINPALKPIFDDILQNVWEEVTDK